MNQSEGIGGPIETLSTAPPSVSRWVDAMAFVVVGMAIKLRYQRSE